MEFGGWGIGEAKCGGRRCVEVSGFKEVDQNVTQLLLAYERMEDVVLTKWLVEGPLDLKGESIKNRR